MREKSLIAMGRRPYPTTMLEPFWKRIQAGSGISSNSSIGRRSGPRLAEVVRPTSISDVLRVHRPGGGNVIRAGDDGAPVGEDRQLVALNLQPE